MSILSCNYPASRSENWRHHSNCKAAASPTVRTADIHSRTCQPLCHRHSILIPHGARRTTAAHIIIQPLTPHDPLLTPHLSIFHLRHLQVLMKFSPPSPTSITVEPSAQVSPKQSLVKARHLTKFILYWIAWQIMLMNWWRTQKITMDIL